MILLAEAATEAEIVSLLGLVAVEKSKSVAGSTKLKRKGGGKGFTIDKFQPYKALLAKCKAAKANNNSLSQPTTGSTAVAEQPLQQEEDEAKGEKAESAAPFDDASSPTADTTAVGSEALATAPAEITADANAGSVAALSSAREDNTTQLGIAPQVHASSATGTKSHVPPIEGGAGQNDVGNQVAPGLIDTTETSPEDTEATTMAVIRSLEEQIKQKDRQIAETMRVGRGSVGTLNRIRVTHTQLTAEVKGLQGEYEVGEGRLEELRKREEELVAKVAATETQQLSALRKLLAVSEQVKAIHAITAKRKIAMPALEPPPQAKHPRSNRDSRGGTGKALDLEGLTRKLHRVQASGYVDAGSAAHKEAVGKLAAAVKHGAESVAIQEAQLHAAMAAVTSSQHAAEGHRERLALLQSAS